MRDGKNRNCLRLEVLTLTIISQSKRRAQDSSDFSSSAVTLTLLPHNACQPSKDELKT